MKRLSLLCPMNLQMFAADDGTNTGGNNAGDNADNHTDQNTDQNTQTENGSADDDQETGEKWKPDKHARAWLAAEINKQKADWEKSIDEKAKNAVTEAQRLADMSDEEKAKEAEAKRIAVLEKREAAIATAELRAETTKQLSENGLPAGFLDMAFADNAEIIKSNIAALKETFDKSVEEAVNARLKQKSTTVGATTTDDDDPFTRITKKYNK